MSSTRTISQTVDAYIANFPDSVQVCLQKMQAIIKRAAPDAEETISYGIPTLKQNGPVIYFAGFKAHISIYPITTTIGNNSRKSSHHISVERGQPSSLSTSLFPTP